jgi:hypothetical protein
MQDWLFLSLIFILILLILFYPELFPQCSLCHKKKPRPFFRIHKAVSINPGYGGSRSVCTKCCREHNIETLDDLNRLLSLKRKVKIKSLSKDI